MRCLSTPAKTVHTWKQNVYRATADLTWVPILSLANKGILLAGNLEAVYLLLCSCLSFRVQRRRNLNVRNQNKNINISAWRHQPFQSVTTGGCGKGGRSNEKMPVAWQDTILPNPRTTWNKLRKSISSLKSKQVQVLEHVSLCLTRSFITGESNVVNTSMMLFPVLLLLPPLPTSSLFSTLRSTSKMHSGPTYSVACFSCSLHSPVEPLFTVLHLMRGNFVDKPGSFPSLSDSQASSDTKKELTNFNYFLF